MAERDALADLRAEIHLWTGDESTPVDLRVLRAAAEEIERLRAREAALVGALQALTADFGLAVMAIKRAENEAVERAAQAVFSALENDRG